MIIGSNAILHWYPDFPRIPKDVDIIKNMYIKEYNSDKRIEWLENKVLQNYFTKPIEIITPNELYTLKISHSLWSLDNGSFEKHLWDVQWLKEKGCKFIPELFYELYNYWEEIHGKRKTSNLEMSAEEFFNNAIDYPIPHDRIHELLIQHPYFKGQKQPTYVKILKEGQEVDVCMKKFSNLAEEEKFNVVFEEVAVMAEERYPKNMYYKAKYERMLKKFITSYAKLEEALWIIQNHKKLLCNIPFDFSQFINKQIKQNELQRT